MTYVYVFAGEDTPLKVGVSKNPPKRLEAVRGSPEPWLWISALRRFDYDAFDVEARAHRLLQAYSAGGEWFETTPRVATLAIERASFEMAMAMTSAWAYGHCLTTGRQKFYRQIIARELRRRGGGPQSLAVQHLREKTMTELRTLAGHNGRPMAHATLKAHLGDRGKMQAEHDREQERAGKRSTKKEPTK